MSDETKNETVEAQAAAPAEEKKAAPKKGPRRNAKSAAKKDEKPAVDTEERVVAVNRVSKVVKGGRRFSFSALIVVGDKKGRVGYGLGKAKEVPDAIRKASQEANKRMINVPLDANGTIPHQILGEFDAGKILFKPASTGTGIKAAGACRAILELAGVKDVLTKSLRGNNSHNIVKATFAALKGLKSTEEYARLRGVDAKGLRLKS